MDLQNWLGGSVVLTSRMDNLCAHSQRFRDMASEMAACGASHEQILELWNNTPSLEDYLKSLIGDPLWQRKLAAYRNAFL